MTRSERYAAGARWYDLISAEPVYRAGRRIGIAQLELHEGDTVIDIGCGTGLNFPLIQDAIGATGRLVGLDASADMLSQARRRADRRGWANVDLLQADATTVAPDAVIAVLGSRADAVLATYALSLMQDWQRAWHTMLAVAGPAARLCVVDMQPPEGPAALLGWLARLACRLGGSDIHARPWSALERDCARVQAASARAGHIQIRTGEPAANLL